MDYEKAYNDALERARDFHDGPTANIVTRTFLESVFPELAESEDERIRKEIIGYLNSRVSTAEETELLYFKRWIAWLEKQKEPQDPFDNEQFCRGYEAGYADAAKLNNPNIQKFDPYVKVTTSDSSASGKELLYVSNKSYDIGFRDGVASVKSVE